MKNACLVWLALCGLPSVSLSAQGAGPGAQGGRGGNGAPRLMMANPFVSGITDSAAAVQVGGVARQAMHDKIRGAYTMVTQPQMNEALRTYGFSPDAILSVSLALNLAKSVGARVVITSTMTKVDGNRYEILARLAGVSDEAGSSVVVTQQPSEPLADFSVRLAKTLLPAVEALRDAKACMDEREVRANKAVQSAGKALKEVPNHGLAEFCLYLLAEQQKAPRQEAVRHLEAAAKGDPLSASVWELLVGAYQEGGDTAKALAAAKQRFRLAPAGHGLQERVFRYFFDAGQPNAVLELTEEGLKADPFDARLHDFRANAFLLQRDFAAAMNALEQRYAADSTTVDTLFFVKFTAAAAAGEGPDTSRLLVWAQTGARKFPANATILGYLNQAYVLTGQIDSSIAVMKRVMSHDTTAVVPVLVAVRVLLHANWTSEVGPFVAFVKQYGDQTQKQQLARLLLATSVTRLQGDSAANQAPNPAEASTLARTVLEIADSSSDEAQQASFLFGAALFRQGAELDPRTEKEKSCEMARQERQLMADAKATLTTVKLERYDKAKQQYLRYIDQADPRVTALVKAYCR